MPGQNCISSEHETRFNDTTESFSLSELETVCDNYCSTECNANSKISIGFQEDDIQPQILNHWLDKRSDMMYKRKQAPWYAPISRLPPKSYVSSGRLRGEGSTRVVETLGGTNINSTTENEEVTVSSKSPKLLSRTRSNSPYSKHIIKPAKQKPLCPSNYGGAPKKSQSGVSDQGSAPRSVVSVKDRSGTLYRLEFTADNARFTPLYVSMRHTPQTGNEKKVQPLSSSYSTSVAKSELNSYFRNKKYTVVDEDGEQRNKKRRTPSSRAYTDEVSSSRRSKSAPVRAENVGYIYISYKNMLLRLKCAPLMIKQIKQFVSPDITAKMERLGMPTSESRKNKGVVVCRHGYDMFQINFEMSDISFKRVETKGTAAVQTEDKLVYIREISPITHKPTLLALPESTYFYADPMKMLHRLHVSFQRTSIMPLWKYEMMRTRINESRGSGKIEADLERTYKQTRGSRLLFEGLDALISTEDGLLCCEVSTGYENYESMMLEEYERNGSYKKSGLASCSETKPFSSKSSKQQPNSQPETDMDEEPETNNPESYE